MLSKIWEDEMDMFQMTEAANKVTFWTKHIAVKHHFLHSHLNDEVKVQKVDITEQLADLITKGFAQ